MPLGGATVNSPCSGPRRRLQAVDSLAVAAAEARLSARACVWLLRLALEHALDDVWAAHAPELVRASMRAQLLVLPKYVDPEEAWQVGELWRVLSRVAHHHAYELTPSRPEILRWRGEVERAVAYLEVSAMTSRAR